MRRALRLTLPLGLALFLLATLAVGRARGGDAVPHTTDAEAGRRHILETPYVPPALDQEVADNLWRVWTEPLRSQAEALDAEARRALVFRHYGLDPRPDDASAHPLQMVVTPEGAWHMSCFTCHGGHVAGQVLPGLPNAHLALQSLVDDVAKTKRLLGRKLAPGDLAASFLPFGETVGTTNAVVFSISLLRLRDEDLIMRYNGKPAAFVQVFRVGEEKVLDVVDKADDHPLDLVSLAHGSYATVVLAVRHLIVGQLLIWLTGDASMKTLIESQALDVATSVRMLLGDD